MELSVLYLLVLLWASVANATPPRVTKAEYLQKNGYHAAFNLELLQYELTADQDVRRFIWFFLCEPLTWSQLYILDMHECIVSPNCSTKPLLPCPPCDYSGQGSACGRVPYDPLNGGCQALCNMSVRDVTQLVIFLTCPSIATKVCGVRGRL